MSLMTKRLSVSAASALASSEVGEALERLSRLQGRTEAWLGKMRWVRLFTWGGGGEDLPVVALTGTLLHHFPDAKML